MSCGQLLLISGSKGKRFATPNSRILMHQISSMTWGKLSDMEVDIDESKKLQEIIESMIVKYTKMNRKQVNELMQRDSYMSANEALEAGLIDGIVKNPNDLYKNPNVNL